MVDRFDPVTVTDDDESPVSSSPPAHFPPPPRKTPLQNEIDLKVLTLMNKVTDGDRAMVAEMADPNYGSHRITLTPVLAALIVSEYNNHNRDLLLAKVKRQSDAMKRGEWRWNHQGIAFYTDGPLADGQHRCYACVLSGVSIPIQVTSDMRREDIGTVDNQSVRNAGDACQLLGIVEPKLKARVMEDVAEYENELKGITGRLTVAQVEKLVSDYDEQLDQAIALGREIFQKVATPVQREGELITCALAMLRGGYLPTQITTFALNTNMGIGDYPECPTTELARVLERANAAERKTHRLTKRQRLALFFKGAALFVQKKSVSKLKWEPGSKEPLPSPRNPELADLAAE